MAKVYLSLGSNLGNKEQNLSDAIYKIEKQIGNIVSQSAFYQTVPWGFTSENTFLNSAIEIETAFPPLELLARTQQIEKEMGRKVKSTQGVYNDRIIDIDILLYDELIYNSEKLTLPHPFMTERLFVMQPLAEIAPSIIHPVKKITITDLYKQIFIEE